MTVYPTTKRGSVLFCLDDQVPGRRRRRFFRTEAEAQNELKAALRQQSQLGKQFDALSLAERAGILEVLREMSEAGWTLRGLWEDYRTRKRSPAATVALGLALKEMLKAKRDAKRREKYVKELERYLGHFVHGREEMPISAVGHQELQDWFAARTESPRSKQDGRALLWVLFSYAERRGWIERNPVKDIERIEVDAVPPCVLTTDQCRDAMLWISRNKPRALGWFALTMFGGLRPDSEADHIQWKDINLKQKRIVVRVTKIRRSRILDLDFCPPLLEWLRLAKRIKSELPIPRMARRRAVTRLRNHMGFKKWPHDIMRKTAASNLLAYHQDAQKVALFLGHSPKVLLGTYKSLVFREDAEKWMALLPNIRIAKIEAANGLPEKLSKLHHP